MLTREGVSSVFQDLPTDPEKFLKHLSDDVNWTVMGTHPLADTYHGKEALRTAILSKLTKLIQHKLTVKVDHIFIDGDTAVAEVHASAVLPNGKKVDHHLCWVGQFAQQQVVKARVYVDSALVTQVLKEIG